MPVGQANGEATAEAAAKRRRGSGRPFVKGDPRIAPIKRKLDAEKPPPPVPELVPVEGTGVLAAMRFVLMNDPCHDSDPLHKLYREMRAGNPVAFGKQFAELSKVETLAQVGGGSAKADTGGASASGTSPPPTPDPGTRRLVGLIDKLLAQAVRESK